MTVSKTQKKNNFLRYSIAQRAILNGIESNDYRSLNIHKVFSLDFIRIFRLRISSTLRSFKWFMRDKILKKIIKQKIILVGTGGHAKVIIDIINNEKKYSIVGCTSSHIRQGDFEGIKVFGTDDRLPAVFEKGIVGAFIAIGDNTKRRIVTEKVIKLGFKIITTIHPNALIAKNSFIGPGTCVMAGSVVNPGTVIGQGCIINTNSNIDHDCIIGDYVHIAPGCSLAGTVSIGKDTFIGTGVNIIPKISVGEKCIIGAGSVVNKDIPKGSKAYGVPIRVIK